MYLYNIFEELNLDDETRQKIMQAYDEERTNDRHERAFNQLETRVDKLERQLTKINDKLMGINSETLSDNETDAIILSCL